MTENAGYEPDTVATLVIAVLNLTMDFIVVWSIFGHVVHTSLIVFVFNKLYILSTEANALCSLKYVKQCIVQCTDDGKARTPLKNIFSITLGAILQSWDNNNFVRVDGSTI